MGRKVWRDPGRGRQAFEHFWNPERVYVLAEAGSNHAGSLTHAISLIDHAADLGADGVKFQLWKWEDIVRDPAGRDRTFELSTSWLPVLCDAAHARGLDFLCTPFAPWAVEALTPYVDAWKIGSFEFRHGLLVEALPWVEGEYPEKPVIMSLGQVEEEKGEWYVPRVILLHCVSEYPHRLEEAHLYRLWCMGENCREMGQAVGYSDHTHLEDACLAVTAAVALGARFVERHLRLHDQPESPDAGFHASPPRHFREYVETIRRMEQAIRPRAWKPAECPAWRRRHGQ